MKGLWVRILFALGAEPAPEELAAVLVRSAG